MYIYTPLCRYWIALYRYVLVFIVPHVDIELEDNKQFISNIPRNLNEMSNLILGKNKKNILKCHLMKLLPSILSVNDDQ